MTQKAQLLLVLEQDIQADVAGYECLARCMDELYGWLMARNCLQIDAANQQISVLLDAASRRAQRRSKVLQAFGLDDGSSAMERLLTLLAPARSASLQADWNALTQQVTHCRTLNERNGRLLAMHKDILQQLLHSMPDSLYQPGV